MHAPEQLLWLIPNFSIHKAEHGLPTGRKVNGIGSQSPIPDAIVGASYRQRVAFLADAQLFFLRFKRFQHVIDLETKFCDFIVAFHLQASGIIAAHADSMYIMV